MRKIKQKEQENPDDCYCTAKKLSPPRSSSDKFLDYTPPVYSKYDFYKRGPATRYPIRECQLCGKGYVDAPAVA
jgi:hypothetical protein